MALRAREEILSFYDPASHKLVQLKEWRRFVDRLLQNDITELDGFNPKKWRKSEIVSVSVIPLECLWKRPAVITISSSRNCSFTLEVNTRCCLLGLTFLLDEQRSSIRANTFVVDEQRSSIRANPFEIPCKRSRRGVNVELSDVSLTRTAETCPLTLYEMVPGDLASTQDSIKLSSDCIFEAGVTYQVAFNFRHKNNSGTSSYSTQGFHSKVKVTSVGTIVFIPELTRF